jgi:hypothetical protein
MLNPGPIPLILTEAHNIICPSKHTPRIMSLKRLICFPQSSFPLSSDPVVICAMFSSSTHHQSYFCETDNNEIKKKKVLASREEQSLENPYTEYLIL